MNTQSILREAVASSRIETSAPCRIDMGGTLDIRTFYLPLCRLRPCTFNMAIDVRTRVRLSPFDPGYLKVSSRGFASAVYPSDNCPFDAPMGLMFAIAAYFGADGVHVEIDSASPPRSALGGSSAAAVALIAAFYSALEQAELVQTIPDQEVALLAHELEESVAGVPCGLQDQLAAVYGGINAWYWPKSPGESLFNRKALLGQSEIGAFEKRILVAYAGRPHESKNINSRWVQQFIHAETRREWREIARCSSEFVAAIERRDYGEAIRQMNRDTSLRCRMTPDVLDATGQALVQAALQNECGARFTGAGGGGCIWALGDPNQIERLKGIWIPILESSKGACLLDAPIAAQGLQIR